jgi:hypothetical protein
MSSTAVLSLLLVIAAPGYAQREQQGGKQDRVEQQQSRHEEARPEQQHAQQQQHHDRGGETPHAQQQRKPDPKQQQPYAQQGRQPDGTQRQPQRAQQPPRPGQIKRPEQAARQQGKEPPRRTAEQQRVRQSAWQQHRAGNWESDHRTWQQRGGYRGYRIPDTRFRGYFGPDHGFRIYGLPFRVVGGYPRFRYSGYWFSLVDPWPESWATNWYDTDDVYVTHVDEGYYLFNRAHPTAGIAIRISI